jgi:hypothetical protein
VSDHCVKFVAVEDKKAAPVNGLMNRVSNNDHPAKMHATEIAHTIVVVAGDVGYGDTLTGKSQNLLHHDIVGLRPKPAALHSPSVDDISDQIEPVAAHVAEEIQ